jgi:hypothetical protein
MTGASASGTARTTRTPAAALQRLLIGYRLTQALGVVARLGIADLLAGGPRSSDDLARTTGSDPGALHRVLRLLASEGVFVETAPRLFDLTATAALLRSDGPASMRPRALIESGEWSAAWAQLPHSVATGRPAFAEVFGAPPFEYYAAHPDAAALFNATMSSMTASVAPAIAAAYDFSELRTVADVGGGHGALLAAILQAHPRCHGILIDQAPVLAGAREPLARAGVAARCSLAPGDFLVEIAADADAYMLKFVLDDWDDDDAVRILRTCRRAMPPHGRILVIEMPIAPGNEPFYGKWTDVNMLVMLGGRERSTDEYARLFARADVALARVIGTSSDFSILEGVAA